MCSQWGDGSVFACDAQDDTLGELLQQLEEDDTDTRWLESADESSSSQAAQQQQQRQAGMLPQTSQQQQHQQQKRSFDEGHATAAGSRPLGGFEVRQQPQVRPPRGWECGGGAPAVPELMLKDDSGTGSPFDAFSPFTTPQLSGRTTSSEAPCVVPDTAIPPPPPLAGAASFGLVPQMMALPPPPHGFMCMPMPPPMMAMPPALVPPTMCQAMPEVNDMQRIRQECLKRYREKKARRMYTKMVRYQVSRPSALMLLLSLPPARPQQSLVQMLSILGRIHSSMT